MNYLRGAFSAASQYYKDLPPINPSTLTGAIDVIVIERPTENGATELVCSPFHVRFGKWQVLRPGEKKVNVLVNGHPIPFDMKIGDAGEAFFVFETDEDVPEELITSPLLKPADAGQPDNRDVSAPEGFPVKVDKEEVQHAEPEFLDLDASEHLDKQASMLHATSDTTQPSVLSTTRPHQADTKGARLDYFMTTATAVRDYTTSNIPQLVGVRRGRSSGNTEEADPGDEVLPPVDQRDIRPPDVTYHHDVVLDAAGYHSKASHWLGLLQRPQSSPSEWSVLIDFRFSPLLTVRIESTSPAPTPEPSREFYPLELRVVTNEYQCSSDLRPCRATSEPPQYGVSASPPPEYSWEWGAFPQRSPTQERLPGTEFSFPHDAGFPPKPTKSLPEPRAESPPRSRSPIPEADTVKLEGDSVCPHLIWLEFEGQRLGFELSLCGEGVRHEGPFEVARRFDDCRVSFKDMMANDGIVHSSELVVRWDDDYIFRSDNSPLMPALVSWRLRSLSAPASLDRTDTKVEGVTAPLPRSSTWSRWWSRSGTLIIKPSPSAPEMRPSLEHAESAPADSVSFGFSLLLSGPHREVTASTVPFPATLPPTPPPPSGKKYAKTLRLTSDQLSALRLNKGANSITFSLSATGQIACTARIFVWDSTDQIVVSDIDGTITKSDALGHVFTLIGRDWTHLGVAKLYTDICRNGYKVMYLTSRAIGQADSTRDYLKGINQNNYQLPEGPVIMSPDRLLTSLHREVIMRKPEVFKMACLRDIQRLFGTSLHNPFYAGFGNRITDALSYRSVDIPSARIFTIDSSGEVKMELLELAGYKSSYIHMTDIVDQMFPPINRKWAPEYTDFHFWRRPIVEFELPEALTRPPSPALSARSDTTTLSRLRNFSLGRSSRAHSPESSISSRSVPKDSQSSLNKHLRSAVSLDRFGSFLPVGEGVEYVDIYAKGKNDDVHFVPNDRGSRPGTIPGSLDLSTGMRDPRWIKDRDDDPGNVEDDEDDNEDGIEDGMDGEDDGGDESSYAGEVADEAFDDDLLATGEMENVPFL
ncbi:LNS2-domain-containing protein [Hysterangium stoloniferum]|nr:LNS2-domain-containing protein [Hysterangium stoloniferum]